MSKRKSNASMLNWLARHGSAEQLDAMTASGIQLHLSDIAARFTASTKPEAVASKVMWARVVGRLNKQNGFAD